MKYFESLYHYNRPDGVQRRQIERHRHIGSPLKDDELCIYFR